VKQNIEEYLEDCSTQEKFQYQIQCENCGKIWKSKSRPFSQACMAPSTEGKRIIYKTLYHREKAEAFSLAAQEAKEVFSRCPICGHLVCDDCFMLCEEIEMCRDCAERLNERGTPVGR